MTRLARRYLEWLQHTRLLITTNVVSTVSRNENSAHAWFEPRSGGSPGKKVIKMYYVDRMVLDFWSTAVSEMLPSMSVYTEYAHEK